MDIAVLAAITLSTALILYFTIFAPPEIVDQIRIDATVAPSDVVSGGLSSLVIRYENTSSQELRFARLNLSFPAHFELKEAPGEFTEVAPQTYDLGTIPAGAVNSIKLRGVMFGDVGGEQTFVSALSFTYGPRDRTATKTDEHNFRPSRSTLVLELILPEKVVQGQHVNGQIKYKNTGEVDFPEIIITPVWPNGFTLLTSSPTLSDGGFRLSSLKAGNEGIVSFSGQMPPTESTDFVFHPSFTFGDDRYTQDTLTQSVKLLPSQISVTTEFSSDTITPGGTMTGTVSYEHVGELPVKNLSINFYTLNQPLFQKSTFEVIDDVISVSPGDKGTTTITLRFNTSVNSRDVSSYENLIATIKTFVNYSLGEDGLPPAAVSLLATTDTFKITSPIILETFGRYTSPQGDQIGRGPLPPMVGEPTKYWVFMTIHGTTNKLENVKMEADLGPGVTFTGKQSVSYDGSVEYDVATNSVSWTVGSLPATLAPESDIISAAFEVSLTPTEDMVGETPTLLSAPLVTARDTFTGAFVTARGSTITTDLPYDSMAAGLGVVTD